MAVFYAAPRVGTPTGATATHGEVSVGTTKTAIPPTNLDNRKALSIFNMSKNASETVYIGNANVTVDNGYPIPPSSSLPLDCSHRIQWYGIVAAGTVKVRYLEVDYA